MIDRSRLILNRKQIPCRQSKNKAIAAGVLPFFKDAACIGCYLPVRGEADILSYWNSQQTPAYALPAVLSRAEMKFYLPDVLKQGAFGIMEPDPACCRQVEPDLLVIPMLAFCGRNRIGYGGGYYDRYLSAHPNSLRIGIAFDEQRIEAEPAPWDEPLDVLVTPESIRVFRPIRSALAPMFQEKLAAMPECFCADSVMSV